MRGVHVRVYSQGVSAVGARRQNMLNKNERKGRLDQAKGHVKQAVGAVIGNESLKAEGRADATIGKLEEAVGHVARTVGNAVVTIGKPAKH